MSDELLELAARIEAAGRDAENAAADDEWYSAICALSRGLSEVADALRARASRLRMEVE